SENERAVGFAQHVRDAVGMAHDVEARPQNHREQPDEESCEPQRIGKSGKQPVAKQKKKNRRQIADAQKPLGADDARRDLRLRFNGFRLIHSPSPEAESLANFRRTPKIRLFRYLTHVIVVSHIDAAKDSERRVKSFFFKRIAQASPLLRPTCPFRAKWKRHMGGHLPTPHRVTVRATETGSKDPVSFFQRGSSPVASQRAHGAPNSLSARAS